MAVSVDALPARIRHRFPIFDRLVYINSCSQGALSDAVREAYARYLADWDEHGAPWEYWVEQLEAARRSVAGLINASEDEVAVTTSVSAGVSALASGLGFETGRDKVVVSDFEFPTIGQIWHAQERRGARVVHVPAEPDATIPLERFDAAIDEETALVSVTHVCFRNGSRIDVAGVTELAHERGALVLLDAYQSVGSIPVDVRALECDFLAAGVLKYLLGSAGLGFLYCRRDLVEQIQPTATGWFADRNIFEMDIHDYSPAPTARRFEAGTPPIPAIYAGIAGIELMQEIGIEETEAHVRELNELLLSGLDELGARVVTPRAAEQRGALVCVASSDVDQLVGALAEGGVVTSSRDDNLRISAHSYNTAEDVTTVLGLLARNRSLLSPR
ncbi:MAG: aminotransferase class V-fold PLP-dependent enzyme [Actinobacteria bacterium]|nr:MAG: aminotransferase class V-fold PLP-dependent enzyme [Actinomycetota bacterium]TMM24743.1 MAG: aminotransferase class V-fold PLP-dependent enzyme [Actinomycetota bacterium]